MTFRVSLFREAGSRGTARPAAGEAEGGLLASKCISCPGTYVASRLARAGETVIPVAPCPQYQPSFARVDFRDTRRRGVLIGGCSRDNSAGRLH